MSQEQHAEAHRLKAQRGWGARRIASELGITRYAAAQLLDRPPADAVAEVADAVAEPVADRPLPVAEPVGRVAGPEQPAVLPQRLAQDDVRAAVESLCQWPGLARSLGLLALTGRRPAVLAYQAISAVEYAYRTALARGDLAPGQPFQVADMTLRPAPAPAPVSGRR